jgi:hypothetical protein
VTAEGREAGLRHRKPRHRSPALARLCPSKRCRRAARGAPLARSAGRDAAGSAEPAAARRLLGLAARLIAARLHAAPSGFGWSGSSGIVPGLVIG